MVFQSSTRRSPGRGRESGPGNIWGLPAGLVALRGALCVTSNGTSPPVAQDGGELTLSNTSQIQVCPLEQL